MHRLSRNMKAGLGCCFQANQAISCSSFFWVAVIIPRRAFSFTGPTANSQPNLMAIYQMPPKVCEPCLLPAVLPVCTAERATGPPQPNGCFQSSCSLHHYSLGYFGIFLPQARHRKFGDFGKRPQKKSHNPVTHPHFTALYFSTAQKQFPQDYREHWHLYHLGPALLLSSWVDQAASLPFPQYSFSALGFCSRDLLCKQTQQTMERADCFRTATWPRPKLWVGNNKVTPCSS